MKTRSLIAGVAAVTGLLALQGPAARATAACGDGSENLHDDPDTAEQENTDDLVVTDAGTVYGNVVIGEDGGYLGWQSEGGYGEVGGGNGAFAEGQSADGSTSYSVNEDGDVCTP